MEVQVVAPMWHQGKQVAPEEGKALPVIDLPKCDAVYLAGLGRVVQIESEDEPVKAGKPSKAKAKKAE